MSEAESTELTTAADLPPLSVRTTLAGKHIFITGTTGFVGKVLLAMIAVEIRKVRRITLLVRTNRQYDDARERFDAVVALSEPFQEVARRIGNEALQDWCDEVVNVVAGDITLDQLGMTDADYHHVTKEDPVDVIFHCAGNVNFDPPLDQALNVNSLGASHKLKFAQDAGCGLVHMSTCFVTGQQSGPISEDREVVGFCPNGAPFDAERELVDAVDLAREVRKRADAQVLENRFYEQAKEALTKQGLDYEDPTRLKDGFKTYKKRWIDKELVREGMERAKQWGWTNTYTYTKSLGEQVTLARARKMGVPLTIVRPAIVESSRHFPFEGWNEGVNTCAPIVYIFWKGHRFVPANPENILDVVPVDYVCRGTLVAGAALLNNRHKTVYQFATGDVNPLRMTRALELTNLAWRARYDEDKNLIKKLALRNMDTIPVDPETYKKISAPAVIKFAKSARRFLKSVPAPLKSPVRPLFKQADKVFAGLEKAAGTCNMILDVFAPFILDNNPQFSTQNTRDAAAQLVDSEQEAFGNDLEDLDWRHYWIDVHMAGLQKWSFGILDDKMRRVKRIARARDLIEVFHTTCRAHAERRAVSHFKDDGIEVTYTYQELWDSARCVAGWLRANGVTKADKVILSTKNEPAWPMIYLGILLADAVAVPVDPEMPQGDIERIARKAEAKVFVLHEDHPRSFPDLPQMVVAAVGDVFECAPIEDVELRDRSNEVASLLFTSGTTGDPKGVMLTHGNFTALLASLNGTFKVGEKDRFLSVLPMYHTFEFSCGFLMPISNGAHIMYLDELEGPVLRSAMKKFRPTGIVGIPALWDVLHRRIETQVEDKGEAARLTYTATLRLSRWLRRNYGVNIGPMVFKEVHKTMGGRVRHFISGGAALSEPVLNAFEGLGFELLEGYGLTEASPVLSVRRPGDRKGGGSVGKALPGVKIQIINPDKDGVGEVIAKGDNVMAGYLNDPEATDNTVRRGWLHTGDLGKLDKDGRIVLVGRRKDLIVTSSGKNVYPDDIEPLYADHELIKELAIVGIPDPQGDERVAALVVLVDGAPSDAQATVKMHFTKVGQGLSDHQRLRTMRFWHGELPRTSIRKVKRKEVRDELIHLLELSKASRREGGVPEGREPAWLYATVAGLTGHEAVDLAPESHLITDLGIGSLQLVELRLLLEERGGMSLDGDAVANAQTVQDLIDIVLNENNVKIVRTRRQQMEAEAEDEESGIEVPEGLATAGRSALHWMQQKMYDSAFKVRVTGRKNIPHNEQCIVISNHCSHLDLGLTKYALGDYGKRLSALAASDYFFDTQYKRDFFEPFTNLIPVDRTAPLEASLRNAESAMRNGRVVLVFPEGTRSKDGELQEFKHGIGYLQSKAQLSILPIYLKGTHRSMAKGSAMPTNRRLSAKIGPKISAEFLAKITEGKNRIETYAIVAEHLQIAIECLRDGRAYPWMAVKKKKISGGLEDVFAELQEKYMADKHTESITWYFSLGSDADSKWTVRVDSGAIDVHTGRPKGGQADCVLKTSPKVFKQMIRESYVPSFAEFADGTVKTNRPDLLQALQSVFGL